MEAASTALQDSSADAVGPREDSRTSLSPAEAVSRELADVKTKIGKTETDIDKVALLIEALEKVEDANTLTPQQSSKLAYLRQEKTDLRQKETDLRQEKTALLQKEARLEALAASTGSKASAGPGKTSARGASRYGQRVQLISRVHAREECGLMFQPLPHPPYLFAFYI
jgi:cell division protein FtsB